MPNQGSNVVLIFLWSFVATLNFNNTLLDSVNYLMLEILYCIVSKSTAFALALSALYENDSEMNVSEADVVGVLAAATFLGFTALEKL